MDSSDKHEPGQCIDSTGNKISVRDTIREADEDGPDDELSKQRRIELEEEKKLKARHPAIQRPGSEFLQKRLQRGQKYFDSGDYNMAKSNPNVRLPDGTTPVTAIDSKLLNKKH